jgi:hypothetical protein
MGNMKLNFRSLGLMATCLLLHQTMLFGQITSIKPLGHVDIDWEEMKKFNQEMGEEYMPSCSHTEHFRMDYYSHKRHSGTLNILVDNDSVDMNWAARIYQEEGLRLNGMSFEMDSTIVKIFPIHDTVRSIILPLLEQLLSCKGDSCYNSTKNRGWCLHGDGILLESVVDREYTRRSFSGCLSYAHAYTPMVKDLFNFFRTYEGFVAADHELCSNLEPGGYTNGYWHWDVLVTEPFLRLDKIGRPASLE